MKFTAWGDEVANSMQGRVEAVNSTAIYHGGGT
jgi:hypothetical protein